MGRKYDIIEHNEEKKEIIIGKKEGFIALFRKKYGKNIYLALFLLCLIVGVLAIYFTVSNFGDTVEPKFEDMNIDFDDEDDIVIDNDDNTVITDENKEQIFKTAINNSLKDKGEILVNNFIDKKHLSIWFLSDGSVLMKKNGVIYRVSAKKDGNYGVSEKGVISADVYSRELTINKTNDYSFGKVEFYSDGSALILSDKDTIFVRNSNDIKDRYISISEVSYTDKSIKLGSYEVTYYMNGMINIKGHGKDIVVHKEDDFTIDGSNINFKYHNEANLIEKKVYKNNTKIRYYDDGSAIIFKNNNYIGVIHSNAIVINNSNNDFFEIVDTYYVKKTKEIDITSGKVYYYNDGSAIIRYDSNEIIYVPSNEDIRYDDNHVASIDGPSTAITELKEKNGNTLEYFDDVVHVKTSDGKEIIAGKNDIDDNGSISKDIGRKISTYTLTNNDNKVLHYRLVLEKSDRTDVDPKYVNYVMEVNNTIKSGVITDNVWNVGSELHGGKTLGKESYILYEGTLDPMDRIGINLMLYYNYEIMGNDMMDKWFYGTFKIYGWEEE